MRHTPIVASVALMAFGHGAQSSEDIAARLSAAGTTERVQALQQMKHPPESLLEPVTGRLLDATAEVRIEAAYAVLRMLVSLGCKPTAVSECSHFKRLLITPPEAAKQVPPHYPDEAVSSRIQGVVVLECVVEEDGSVSRVFANTGPPLLHKSAEHARSQWRYKPARLKGQPEPFAMLVTMTFSLQRS